MGWFYDLDFKDEIDFNYDKIPKKIYDKNGDYQYIENKFYAKWKNIETKKIYKYDIYK